MADRSYTCQGHTFEFHFHPTSNGYHSRVAVCVKNRYGRKELTPLEEQILEDHPKVKEQLEQEAWDDTQYGWWEWAKDEARAAGYEIYSCGRSGGWLYFDKVDFERVEYWAEYGNRCDACGGEWEDHPTSECASFVRQGSELQTLKELEALCKMYADSIKQVPELIAERLSFMIEECEGLQEPAGGVL